MPSKIDIPETNESYTLNDDNTVDDHKRNRWSATGVITATGEGDTYGPNHPNTPPIIAAIRRRMT